MSNPTTTGEWTVEMLINLSMNEVADMHNAALAAEREYYKNAGFNEGVAHEIGRTVEAQQQLDAEREKVKMLIRVFEKLLFAPASQRDTIIHAALAKIGEGGG